MSAISAITMLWLHLAYRENIGGNEPRLTLPGQRGRVFCTRPRAGRASAPAGAARTLFVADDPPFALPQSARATTSITTRDDEQRLRDTVWTARSLTLLDADALSRFLDGEKSVDRYLAPDFVGLGGGLLGSEHRPVASVQHQGQRRTARQFLLITRFITVTTE